MAANAAVADGKIVVVAAGNSGDAEDTIVAGRRVRRGHGRRGLGLVGARRHDHDEGVFLAYFSSRGGETFAGDQEAEHRRPRRDDQAAEPAPPPTTSRTAGRRWRRRSRPARSRWRSRPSRPSLPAAALAALESTAEDFGPLGKDADWGAGLIDVLGLTAEVQGLSAERTFPQHVHVNGIVPDSGQFTYDFDLGPEALDVPIAATIVIDGDAVCTIDLPPFGCLIWDFSPDLDAELLDPNGLELAVSTCAAGTECVVGRQETPRAADRRRHVPGADLPLRRRPELRPRRRVRHGSLDRARR